jgi:hypothetical protein
LITLSNGGKNYRVQIAALQTSLPEVVRGNEDGDASSFSFVSFPMYEPSNPQPFLRHEDFNLRSQCLIYLDDNAEDALNTEDADMTDSICLFLYEVRSYGN